MPEWRWVGWVEGQEGGVEGRGPRVTVGQGVLGWARWVEVGVGLDGGGRVKRKF